MLGNVRNINRVAPTTDATHSHTGGRSASRMTQRADARSVIDLAAEDALSTVDAFGDETEDASLFLFEYSKRSDRRSRAVTTASKSLGRLASRLRDDDIGEAIPSFELLPAIVEGAIETSELSHLVGNPGEMALLLAAALTQMPESKRRKGFSDLLDRIVASDDWAIALFSQLEFKGGADQVRAELASLYEAACGRERTLVQLFERLKTLKQRNRKLRVLIRALGAEMTQCDDYDRIRLASVNRDLKRLLLFMGLEEQCTFIAASSLNDSARCEDILKEVLSIVDQAWPSVDWAIGRARNVCVDDRQAYRYTVKLRRLMQMLPDVCFNDEEHQGKVVEVLLECAEALENEA
jgi:type III secretion system TyeA family effector delivery regulator